ncbi:hypothetical protein ACFV1L_33060 [Kitasatospora sp. NPDC059646]|uniref:hypothetical protein n=1 Tax=Kitasatospora sp. NPDC059646 TaxID=3346893 RepID=UPI003679CFC9
MSAAGGGRPGALPPAGYRPRRRAEEETPLQVLFIPEDAEEPAQVFDFARLTVSPELQQAFAKGFVQRTKAGGRLRRLGSAEKSYRFFRGFATYLGTLNTPPTRPRDLLPVHLDGWRLERQNYASLWHQVGEMIKNLRAVPGLGPELRTALNQRQPEHANRRRERANPSYSRAEMQRILNAARHDVRQAAARIRAGQVLADRWRAGDLDGEPPQQQRRGRLAAFVEEHADVPRTPRGAPQWWVRELGTVAEHMEAVHLSALEIAAFVILLVAMTGENGSAITKAPAGHHRPDGHAGGIASAIVELDKPRRGSRRHMDRPLVDLPKWAGARQKPPGRGRTHVRGSGPRSGCSCSCTNSPKVPAACWEATGCWSGGPAAAAEAWARACAPERTATSSGPGPRPGGSPRTPQQAPGRTPNLPTLT